MKINNLLILVIVFLIVLQSFFVLAQGDSTDLCEVDGSPIDCGAVSGVGKFEISEKGDITCMTDKCALTFNEGQENQVIVNATKGVVISPLGKITFFDEGSVTINGTVFENINPGIITFNTESGEIITADFYTAKETNYDLQGIIFTAPINSRVVYKNGILTLPESSKVTDLNLDKISRVKGLKVNVLDKVVLNNLGGDYGVSEIKTNKTGDIESIKLYNSRADFKRQFLYGKIPSQEGKDVINFYSFDGIIVENMDPKKMKGMSSMGGGMGGMSSMGGSNMQNYFETGTGTKVNAQFKLNKFEKLKPSLELISVFPSGISSKVEGEDFMMTSIGSNNYHGINVMTTKVGLDFASATRRYSMMKSGGMSSMNMGNDMGGMMNMDTNWLKKLPSMGGGMGGMSSMGGSNMGGNDMSQMPKKESFSVPLDFYSNFKSFKKTSNGKIIIPTEFKAGVTCDPLNKQVGCSAEIVKRVYDEKGVSILEYSLGYSSTNNFEKNVVGAKISVPF